MACEGITKVILVLFNGILFLVGLAPLIFGSLALGSQDILTKVLEYIPGGEVVQELIKNSAIYLIVFGVVVVIVSGLGLFGACNKNKCFLTLYFVVLCAIIVAEIAVVVIAFAYPDTFSAGAKDAMRKTMKDIKDCKAEFETDGTTIKEYNCGTNVFSLGWHKLQYELKCCGADDLADYNSSDINWVVDRTSSLAPLTCCARELSGKFPPKPDDKPRGNCYSNSNRIDDYVNEGCFDAAFYMVTTSPVVIGILAAIGTLELILVISTLIQMCSKDKHQ